MTKLGDREIPPQIRRFGKLGEADAKYDDLTVTGVLFQYNTTDSGPGLIRCLVYLEGEHDPVFAFCYVHLTMTFGDELVGQTFGAIRRQFRERDIALATGAGGAPIRSYSFTLITDVMPTQVQGRTDDDRPYYFRARRGEWALHLGRPGWPDDFNHWPNLGVARLTGEDRTHGQMSEEQVRAVLDQYLVGVDYA